MKDYLTSEEKIEIRALIETKAWKILKDKYINLFGQVKQNAIVTAGRVQVDKDGNQINIEPSIEELSVHAADLRYGARALVNFFVDVESVRRKEEKK